MAPRVRGAIPVHLACRLGRRTDQRAARLAETTAALEGLLDQIGDDPAHPLADLAQLLIERVTAYEQRATPVPDSSPAEMLAYLMDLRGLTQAQVAAGSGLTQPVVSQLLAGKRQVSADHARRLAAYFGVEPSVFI